MTLTRATLALALLFPAPALACGMMFEDDSQLIALMAEVDQAEVVAVVDEVQVDPLDLSELDLPTTLTELLAEPEVAEALTEVEPVAEQPELTVDDLDDPTAIFVLAQALPPQS